MRKREGRIAQAATALVLAIWNCFVVFSHQPPFGVVMKFLCFTLLVVTWIRFWSFVANTFRWSTAIRALVPGFLFAAPMAMVHAVDPSVGAQKGDLLGAVLLWWLVAFLCTKAWTQSWDQPPDQPVSTTALDPPRSMLMPRS